MGVSVSIGRPRSAARKRPGATARDEILDAAAELFTTGGFTATSTRAIADAVGVRQASLYNHFENKDAMLMALLAGTVEAPAEFARSLPAATDDPRVRIHALTWFDARHLTTSTWNLGALYLLPELRSDRFDAFRRQRWDLREEYARLSTEALRRIGVLSPDDTVAAHLPFRLVESIINARSDADLDDTGPDSPRAVADAALRVLGLTAVPDAVTDAAAELVEGRESAPGLEASPRTVQ